MKDLEKHPEWKVMFEKFENTGYDSVIKYEDLDRCLITGSIRGERRYVFEKFKKEMLVQRMKALENVENVGYRVCNPNEHVRLTNREIKRAERRARAAVEIIGYVDYEYLTDREKAIANLTASRVQTLAATIIGEQKAIKEEQKFKLPYNPRN